MKVLQVSQILMVSEVHGTKTFDVSRQKKVIVFGMRKVYIVLS